MEENKKWKAQNFAYKEALTYIQKRRKGEISSFKTPWKKVNDAGVNGFEWHSLTIIAGRPASGKTLMKDQIVRESMKNNKGVNINILEFQLEMVARVSKVREFCSVLGKPYKYVCSADNDNMITPEDWNKLLEYTKEATAIDKIPVDIVENPCTVEELKKIISDYMESHSQTIDGKKIYTNTVVTLDHSLLLKKANDEGSKTDMLYNLGEALTFLKRMYPIAFIVLSQLGRNVETPERNENGKYGNFILPNDIFGGDALLQHADLVIGINRPALKSITEYGPDRYIIEDDSIIVLHFLKCRNGDTRMSFFKAEFDKMKLVETETPKTKKGLSI